VDVAGGGANLVIGVRADVFHEEVEDARVALEHAEELERTVFGFDLGFRRRGRDGRGLNDEAELGNEVVGQFSAEKKGEKGAEGE